MDEKLKKKVGLNGLFLALTLVVNALGAFGFINGTTQSDVSNEYFTLITPSSTTFSIWSVIYGLLIASLVVMYLKRNEKYYEQVKPCVFKRYKSIQLGKSCHKLCS